MLWLITTRERTGFSQYYLLIFFYLADTTCDLNFDLYRLNHVIWAVGGMLSDPPDTVFMHYVFGAGKFY